MTGGKVRQWSKKTLVEKGLKNLKQTFFIVDEVDNFLFEQGIYKREVQKQQKVDYLPFLLRKLATKGIIGLSGTIDKTFGFNIAKQEFKEVELIRFPSWNN